MESKTFGLSIISIFALVLIMGFGSATVDFVNVIGNSQTIYQGNTATFTFDVQATSFTGQFDNAHLVLPDIFGTSTIWTGDTGNFTLLPNSSESKTVSVIIPSNQAVGVYTGNISFTGTYNLTTYTPKINPLLISITVTQVQEIIPEEITACSLTGNKGDLKIKDIDINNEGISGTEFGDDDAWFPMDEIEVEIDIENDGDEDIDDIEITWGLYNPQTDEWIIDDDESDFNLKDGDDKTITITFKLDDNIDELEDEDFIFYVWATGEIDGGDYDGYDTCASDSESIEVIIEDDFVVLDEIEFPEVVSCGTEVQILADVWNIGDEDQDDVYVRIYNKVLGINEKVEIGDIDAFDNEELNAIIEIPEDAEEKYYPLTFWVYDEDDDVYENDYDDDEAEFVIPLKVEGNCIEESKVMVSAILESGGKAGKEMVIKATITNTGNGLANYNLNVVGHTEWASLVSIEPGTVLLGAGDSKEVLITFDVNKDASGDKLFNIEVLSGDEIITKQPVSVFIEESGFSFPGITGGVISKDNAYLWGIGILNIILVLVIIFVAIRVARK